MSDMLSTLGLGVDSSGVRSANKDLAEFQKEGKGAEKAAKELESAMAGASAKGTAIGIAIVEAAKKAFQLAEAFVQAGVSLGKYQDMAERTNADPAGLASMQAAADVAGTSLESLGMSMNILTQRLSTGKEEASGAARALKFLGINTKEFIELKSDEQFRQLSEKMFQYANASDRVALAQTLFGRAGAQKLAMMKELNEESKRSSLITNEMIKRADDLSEKMTRQRTETGQLIKVLSADGLLGTLTDLAGAAGDVAKAIGGVSGETDRLDSTHLKQFGEDAADVFAFMVDAARGAMWAVKSLWTVIKAAKESAFVDMATAKKNMQEAFSVVGGSAEDYAKNMFQDRVAKRRAARKEEENAELVWQSKFGPRQPEGGGKSTFRNEGDAKAKKAGKEKVGGIPEYMQEYIKLAEAQDKFIAGLAKETATMGMTRLEAGLYTVALTDLDDTGRKMATDLLIAQDTKRQDLELEKERKEVLQSLLTPLELYQQEIVRLNSLKLDELTLSKALAKADKEYIERTKAKTSEIDAFTMKAAENIQSALGDNLANILSGKFDNIGDSFKRMLDQMVAQALAAELAKKMFGEGYGKTTSEVGGWLRDLMGFFGLGKTMTTGNAGANVGGFVGADFPGGVVPFASGGRPPMGRASLIGERGPELWVPDGSGTIVPNHKLGGGSVNIVQHINVAGGASYADVVRAATVAKQEAMAGVAEMMRRGSRAYT